MMDRPESELASIRSSSSNNWTAYDMNYTMRLNQFLCSITIIQYNVICEVKMKEFSALHFTIEDLMTSPVL